MGSIVLDFETYYAKDYSLTKLTTQQYVDDPRFEVIGVAVKVDNEPTEWFSGTMDETKDWLEQFDWESAVAVAHNALFDATILTWRFGIKPKMWADTLSMARAVHGTEVGGSLKALAEHYKLGAKGDEVINALGKRRVEFDDAELDRYGQYCINDVDLTYKLFGKLAGHFNKSEAKLIDMTIRMHSEPMLELDLPILEDHLRTVRATKAMLLMQCSAGREILMSNPKFAELLRSHGIEPPMKISRATGKPAYAFAKTDEGMKELLEHPNVEVQALAAARVGVKSTLEETRTERFIDMAKSGGALPVPLKYYGAMTGRWAASDGTNLQNIPRGSPLKKAIVAPEGYCIVGADLSNIELRVGLYFAGEFDKLRLLTSGIDLYKDFASSVFSVNYNDVNEDQRFIGKTSQLSLIYGTGPAKLQAAIKSLSGKDIGDDVAKYIVDLYRREYSLVKEAWYAGASVLEWIWQNNPMNMYGSAAAIQLPVHGYNGIKLPSNMYLRYPDLQCATNELNRTEWTYAQRKERVRIHGPKCFQNVIQALARCVMGEAMIRIHKEIPVCLTIHDAVYCAVPKRDVRSAMELIVTELKREPVWAPNLPLDAECGAGKDLSFKMSKLEKALLADYD